MGFNQLTFFAYNPHMADYAETMRALKGYGTAQNRKIYARHGADPTNVHGVSFANLEKLRKDIKRDNRLARRLWLSGNYDARNLATKIADPAAFTQTEARHWVKLVDNHLHAGLLGGLLAHTSYARALIAEWTGAKAEYVRETGYSLLSSLLKSQPDSISAEEALDYARRIETEIHDSPNWARYGMNWALIALGVYKDEIRSQVLQAAERIGLVEVDHGETSCKTPKAVPYIQKAIARRREKRRRGDGI